MSAEVRKHLQSLNAEQLAELLTNGVEPSVLATYLGLTMLALEPKVVADLLEVMVSRDPCTDPGGPYAGAQCASYAGHPGRHHVAPRRFSWATQAEREGGHLADAMSYAAQGPRSRHRTARPNRARQERQSAHRQCEWCQASDTELNEARVLACANCGRVCEAPG